MNCFYAPSQPAIGICKSCGKGLSLEYATDVGNGLACKNSCEERVVLINSMIDSNSKVMAVANTQLRGNTIFSVVSGVLFVGVGYFMGLTALNPMGMIFAAMGLVMVVRGFLSYRKSARYPVSKTDIEKVPMSEP